VLGEIALGRFIDASFRTLTHFKISYRCNALTDSTSIKLARCENLTLVEFG
jgi:hypothetical protein